LSGLIFLTTGKNVVKRVLEERAEWKKSATMLD
jgi:hypothetical protein